jgi:flagellar protein FlaJ
VDKNVPRLLRDIAEAVHSGMTLPKALEAASQRNYGPLSRELKRAISLFIFGESWQNSLNSLRKRLNRPSVLRLSTILIEAHQAGGKIIEVLETSGNILQSLDEHKEEQYNNMRPYITTMYMATIIFLIISRIILGQFLAPLCQTSNNINMAELGFMPSVLNIEYYTSLLFWASIIEAIFGGLIAGKMGDGSLAAGIFHSVILMVLTLIFFNIRI